ncbi:MAG: hypothetical protein LBR53_05680 [Deltaproteobacteria bacterium]|jgi:MoaA/NifB/PqqE/SkfB family radical SAM enzyme|nr:hypothetical protein [Deltaproteobacteria bacterium]
MNLEEVKKISESRDIYLWGARRVGFSTLNSLAKEGVLVKGFLDSSPDIQGTVVRGQPVFPPNEILAKPPADNFIVITSELHVNEISNVCDESGLSHNKDYIAALELQTYDYIVDVSGVCNLKCLSCPRGNRRIHPKPGFMSASHFEKVLTKIVREDPLTGAIALYNLGEPLLNPEFPEIVEICNSKGVLATLSSNINIKKSFVDTIKAKPALFRISASGYGSSYEITHRGGNWNLFLDNMYKLNYWREKYNPEMQVEVFYHLYKDRTEDYQKMAKLCKELNFSLRVCHAALLALDNINSFLEGETLTEEAIKTMELQILSVTEAMSIAKKTQNLPCTVLSSLAITWDSKVMACSCWYDPKLRISDEDFLDIPLEKIVRLRNSCELCKLCRKNGLHRYFNAYLDESLVRKKDSLYKN